PRPGPAGGEPLRVRGGRGARRARRPHARPRGRGAAGARAGGRASRAAAGRCRRRHRRRRRVLRCTRRRAPRGTRPRRGARPRLRGRRAHRLAEGRPAVAPDGARDRRGAGRVTRIVLDCDPGHDDAIALMLALASPEVELLGVTTVSGNQTVEKTTANALRVLELAGRDEIAVAAGAGRPLVREPFVAAYVHGESGLDGPALPPPARGPVEQHAVDFIAERVLGSERAVTLVPTGPLTNIALFLARHPEAATRVERIVLM